MPFFNIHKRYKFTQLFLWKYQSIKALLIIYGFKKAKFNCFYQENVEIWNANQLNINLLFLCQFSEAATTQTPSTCAPCPSSRATTSRRGPRASSTAKPARTNSRATTAAAWCAPPASRRWRAPRPSSPSGGGRSSPTRPATSWPAAPSRRPWCHAAPSRARCCLSAAAAPRPWRPPPSSPAARRRPSPWPTAASTSSAGPLTTTLSNKRVLEIFYVEGIGIIVIAPALGERPPATGASADGRLYLAARSTFGRKFRHLKLIPRKYFLGWITIFCENYFSRWLKNVKIRGTNFNAVDVPNWRSIPKSPRGALKLTQEICFSSI